MRGWWNGPRYCSSSMVFGTIHVVRGWIEDGIAIFWSVQLCSNRAMRMNGPDFILKFLNHMNGTEWCRICGTVWKKLCMWNGSYAFPSVWYTVLLYHLSFYWLVIIYTTWQLDNCVLQAFLSISKVRSKKPILGVRILMPYRIFNRTFKNTGLRLYFVWPRK